MQMICTPKWGAYFYEKKGKKGSQNQKNDLFFEGKKGNSAFWSNL